MVKFITTKLRSFSCLDKPQMEQTEDAETVGSRAASEAVLVDRTERVEVTEEDVSDLSVNGVVD
jgi:hypothetical protein